MTITRFLSPLRRFPCKYLVHFSKYHRPYHRAFCQGVKPPDSDDERPASHVPVDQQPPWLLVDADFARKAYGLDVGDLENIPYTLKPVIQQTGSSRISKPERKMWYKRELWNYAVQKGHRINDQIFANEIQHPYAFSDSLLPKKPTSRLNMRPLGSYPGGTAVRAALINNGCQFVVKTVLAIFTNSSAIAAEAVHSLTDFLNQLLQRQAVLGSKTVETRRFPFGKGMQRFTYAAASGQIMFVLGGVVTYHGFHTLADPQAIENVGMAISLCCFAFALESYSVNAAYKAIREDCKRTEMRFMEYLRDGADSSSVHVFMEDCAGLLSSMVALGAVIGSQYNPILDPMGSVFIGGIVMSTGAFLSIRNAQLLVGKSIPPNLEKKIINVLEKNPVVHQYHNLRTLILGVESVLVKVDVLMNADKIVDREIDSESLRNILLKREIFQPHPEFHDFLAKQFAEFHQIITQEKTNIEFEIAKALPYKKTYVYVDLY